MTEPNVGMFVADVSKVSSPAMRRMLADGRQPWFSREQFERAREFFAVNPDSQEALCFYDGRIEDAQKYVTRTHHSNPYIASIVAVGQDGIPLPISRRSLEIWTWKGTVVEHNPDNHGQAGEIVSVVNQRNL